MSHLDSRGFGQLVNSQQHDHNTALPYPIWNNERNFSYFSSWEWAASKGIPDPDRLRATLSPEEYYCCAARPRTDWAFSPSARQAPVLVRALSEPETMALSRWVDHVIKCD